MAIQFDPEEELIRLREEQLIAERERQSNLDRYAHEEKMAEIEVKAKAKYENRSKRISAFAKAPAIFVFALWIPVLLLCKRPVPKFLQDYMSV